MEGGSWPHAFDRAWGTIFWHSHVMTLWAFSCYCDLYMLSQYHKHQLFWNKTHQKLLPESIWWVQWMDWKSERGWCFGNLLFCLLFGSVIITLVNLISLLLNGIKFSGIFLPRIVFLSYPAIGWEWMEAGTILEGVISVFLGGHVGLEHSGVTNGIPRRKLSKVSVQQLFFPWCEDLGSPGSRSPTASPGVPCRSISQWRLAFCSIDLGNAR